MGGGGGGLREGRAEYEAGDPCVPGCCYAQQCLIDRRQIRPRMRGRRPFRTPAPNHIRAHILSHLSPPIVLPGARMNPGHSVPLFLSKFMEEEEEKGSFNKDLQRHARLAVAWSCGCS